MTRLFLYIFLTQSLQITSQTNFEIIGKAFGDYSGLVYLSYEGNKDSCLIIDGKFIFSGHVEHPVQAWLNLKPSSTIAWLYIEPADIKVSINTSLVQRETDLLNVVSIESVAGSNTYLIESSFNNLFEQTVNDPQQDIILLKFIDSLATEYPHHSLPGKYLAEVARHSQNLTFEHILSVYNKLDLSVQDSFNMDNLNKTIARLKNYPLGSAFPNYVLTDPNDDTIHIGRNTNKLVLYEFWASWCGPCIRQFPDIKARLNPLRSEHFEIVGISIDKDREKWLSALKKHDLPWMNFFAEGGWQSEIVKDFGICSMPFNILIDANSNILAYNVSIDSIEKLINNSKK